jgi:hypothetical protein
MLLGISKSYLVNEQVVYCSRLLANTSKMNARQSLAKPLSRPNYSASLIRHQISATTSKQPVNGQLSRFKTTAASNQNTVASQEEKQNLSWAEYLSIRGKKRRWELVSRWPSASLNFQAMTFVLYDITANANVSITSFIFFSR